MAARTYRDRVLKTLRQPRYAALSALMIIVALACVAAGTWQIFRFEQKRHENDQLRHNAHSATTTVDAVLPLVGAGTGSSSYDVDFRPVRARGRYDAKHQSLVRDRTIGDDVGFIVLTPLQTRGGSLLVARGFIAQPASGAIPTIPAPPPGEVTVLASVRAPESRNDEANLLNDSQVRSINPGDQAARLGTDVYDGYAELGAGQPGTAGVRALPAPSLANPAGGALEPQHFAYVIQWYLFALLALAAPIVMARAETRTTSGSAPDFDVDEPVTRVAAPPTEDDRRASRLADRYGRPVRR